MDVPPREGNVDIVPSIDSALLQGRTSVAHLVKGYVVTRSEHAAQIAGTRHRGFNRTQPNASTRTGDDITNNSLEPRKYDVRSNPSHGRRTTACSDRAGLVPQNVVHGRVKSDRRHPPGP